MISLLEEIPDPDADQDMDPVFIYSYLLIERTFYSDFFSMEM